jgi:hypothetical protein
VQESKLVDFVDWLDQQLEFHHDASQGGDVWPRKKAANRFEEFAHARRAVHEYLEFRRSAQAGQNGLNIERGPQNGLGC